MNDHLLLREYVDNRSEKAFAELVRRHLPLVYATALRLARDVHTAEEVTQTVFIQLARKACTVREGHALSGWLYRATQRAYFMRYRQESRRRQRETEAVNLADLHHPSAAGDDQLTALLDEALAKLSRAEQDAVLLRFIHDKGYRDVGSALGLSERAAHQRVTRSLEKMRRYFSRRGVTTTAALLAIALNVRAASTVPSGLESTVIGVSLASHAGQAGWFYSVWHAGHAWLMQRGMVAGAAMVAMVAAIPLGIQYHELNQLREQGNAAALAPTPSTQASRADALNRIFALSGRLARLRALIDLASSLDARGVANLLQQIARRPLVGDNADAAAIFIERWVQLDPSSALSWVNALPNGVIKNKLTTLVFTSWSGTNPTAAFAATAAIENLGLRSKFRQSVLATMASSAPAQALQLIAQLPPGQDNTSLYLVFLSDWAQQDPGAAAANVLALPNNRIRAFAVSRVVDGWSQIDPMAALTWADAWPGQGRDDSLPIALGALTQQDPVAAVKYLATISNLTVRTTMVGVVADNWAQTDPKAALDWVTQSTTGSSREAAIKTLLGCYSQRDPVAAVEQLDLLPEGSLRDSAILQIGGNWGDQDRSAALAWAANLTGNLGASVETRRALMTNLVQKWAQLDPSAAAAYVQTRPGDPDYDKLIEVVSTFWQACDPAADFAWAKSLPFDAGGREALRNFLTQYAAHHPQDAWDYAMQLSQNPELRDQSMVQILAKWGKQNPAQAAAALVTAPFGEAHRVVATASLAETWLQLEPEPAMQWIGALPEGAARDSAVKKLVDSKVEGDLPLSFHWAVSLGDDGLRKAELATILARWAGKDSAAAANALQAAALGDDERAALLEVINHPANAHM